MTHEFQLGLDRELMPNFGISGTFTYRGVHQLHWRNNGLVGTDYARAGRSRAAIRRSATTRRRSTSRSRIPANRAATEYRDRDGYSQRYIGFELAATKRLSNRWMARFGFSTNDHREYFDSLGAMTDPTPTATSTRICAAPERGRWRGAASERRLRQVGHLPGAAEVPVHPTGMYQARWGINLAANMVSRQGFAQPYYRTPVETDDPAPRQDRAARGRCRREPSADDDEARRARRQGVHVQPHAVEPRPRRVQRVQHHHHPGAPVQPGSRRRATTCSEIMNPRVLRLGLRFNF